MWGKAEKGGTVQDWSRLPAPTVVGRVKGLQMIAAFGLDPVGALNRHFMPLGRAVEITRVRSKRRMLFIWGPEYNRQFLLRSKTMRTSGLWPLKSPPGTAQRSLSYHPLKAYGPEHAVFDDLIDPYFNRSVIEQRGNDIRSTVVEEVERWSPGVHDFYALARRCTERVAFTLLFGVDESGRFNQFADRLHEYHRANWWYPALAFPVDLPGTPYHGGMRQAEALQAYLYSWMDEAEGNRGQKFVFQRLADGRAANGCPFSRENKAGLVAMLSWLAYETTATALSWTVFLLAQHPAILADLIDELSTLDSAHDGDADRLLSLPLLDAVVKEAMRLIAPVPLISFRMAYPDEIAGQGFPGGSRIYVLPHLTHRLPEIYPAPDRFRPGRWFSIKPTAYEYLPFGGGQRRCPGFWLAMSNLKFALAALLERFRPVVPDHARIDRKYAVVTMPKNGLPLELVPRDRGAPTRPSQSASGSIFELFTPEPDRPVRH
jgi:cytochrome P450